MTAKKPAAKRPAPKQATPVAREPVSKFYVMDADGSNMLEIHDRNAHSSVEEALDYVKQECIDDGVANVENGDSPHVIDILEVRVLGRYSIATQNTATATPVLTKK